MRGLLGKFRRNQDGATIIEFALLMPMLLMVFLGSVTAFDLFRNGQNIEKATFTVGDMLSRQTSISSSLLTDMLELMRNMVATADNGGMRVSSIAREDGEFVLRWSRSLGENVPNTPLETSLLPEIADGDTVLLTESFVPHGAIFAGFGLGDITFNASAAHRPRFVTAIPFQ